MCLCRRGGCAEDAADILRIGKSVAERGKQQEEDENYKNAFHISMGGLMIIGITMSFSKDSVKLRTLFETAVQDYVPGIVGGGPVPPPSLPPSPPSSSPPLSFFSDSGGGTYSGFSKANGSVAQISAPSEPKAVTLHWYLPPMRKASMYWERLVVSDSNKTD